MQKSTRPTGVTMVAILGFLLGIIAIAGGGWVIGVANSSILTAYGYDGFSGAVTVVGGLSLIVGLYAVLVS